VSLFGRSAAFWHLELPPLVFSILRISFFGLFIFVAYSALRKPSRTFLHHNQMHQVQHNEARAHLIGLATHDVQHHILEVRARFARPVVSAPSATRPTCPSQPSLPPISHPHTPISNLQKVVDVAHQNHLLVLELYARLGLTLPATSTPIATRPVHPTSPAPCSVLPMERHDSLSCLTLPTVPRVTPTTPPHHILAGLPPHRLTYDRCTNPGQDIFVHLSILWR